MILPKFVSRQNENVRVAERFADRQRSSSQALRSRESIVEGPMKVPVKEISSSRHVGSTCKALSHGRAICVTPYELYGESSVMSEGRIL